MQFRLKKLLLVHYFLSGLSNIVRYSLKKLSDYENTFDDLFLMVSFHFRYCLTSISGLYYKHITIVNGQSSKVMPVL